MATSAPGAAPPSTGQPATTNLRVYSTLSRSKEPFEPIAPGKVGIYLCGPTVYKPSHIGHLVGPVIFDVVKRYLTYSGYQVTWVVNITDIDDKLIHEAAKRGIGVPELAREMTADYMTNLAALGIDTIDHFPRATDNIPEIVDFIQALIDKGFAYAAAGDVYFDVAKDSAYGKLSGRDVASMQGEGGEMADRKHSVADFALWKGAKPGEPSWDSPWGPGRPGWHIECSAMSRRLLGETFDIHGGGLDLMFPHHENEIAQSECCHGQPQAKYWMHNGLMQAVDEVGKVGGRNTRASAAGSVDAAGEQAAQEAGKMGKSKGASPFRDLLKTFSPETIRLFILSSHYRSPIYFSDARIGEAAKSLETFYRFFQRYERVTGRSYYQVPARNQRGSEVASTGDTLKSVAERRERFLEAMDDDFNTGAAVAELFELVRALNRLVDERHLEDPGKKDAAALATLDEGVAVLRELASLLNLFQQPVVSAAAAGANDELVAGLMGLVIELRADARAAKNFAVADKIRNKLAELKITLADRPGGTDWTIG
ncbi:MAG: cysteine--tRNA ligase [Pirellulales bacterium]|nr:cysteine--tRNA ligase [Pirellulales bacterium]